MKALQRSGLSQRAACKIVRTRRRSPQLQASAKAQEDARIIARLTELAHEQWRVEYNTEHPHSGLGGKTPEEFLALYETTPIPQLSLAS